MLDDKLYHHTVGHAKLDTREGKSKKKNKAFAHKYTHTRDENMMQIMYVQDVK